MNTEITPIQISKLKALKVKADKISRRLSIDFFFMIVFMLFICSILSGLLQESDTFFKIVSGMSFFVASIDLQIKLREQNKILAEEHKKILEENK